ncbi:MAG: hypothetical protein P9M06_07375 [Candidatus Saelkia tenebricola]|nr:hypothetical protein [Candidatus Saelkia tenebricola]
MEKVKILSIVLIVFCITMLVSSSNCFAGETRLGPQGSMPQYYNDTNRIMHLLLNPDGGLSPDRLTTPSNNGSTVTRTTNPSTGESTYTIHGDASNAGSTSQYVPTTTTQGEYYPQIPPNVSNQTITVHMNMIGTSGKYKFHGHPGQIITTPQGQLRLPYIVWDQEHQRIIAQFIDTNYDGKYNSLEQSTIIQRHEKNRK